MPESQRRNRLLFIYFAAVFPWIVFGAAATLRSNANSPLDWVPSTFAPRANFDRFRSQFGSGDLLIAGWPGCRIDAPQLDNVVHQLETLNVFRTDQGVPYFDLVTSGRRQLQLLEQLPQPVSPVAAAKRLQGSLVGPDGRSTYLVVGFTPEGLANRARLVDLIRAVIHQTAHVAYDDIHLAGPIFDGHRVDQASKATLNVLALPSALVVLALARWCLGSWRAAAVVFGIAAICQAATLSFVYYLGDTMSALLIVLPPLIQVLAIAGGLHLANYYFAAPPDEHDAAQYAWRQGWLPSLLSGGTTALGLASLAVSQLTPIRAFAKYGSLGVSVTTILVLVALPRLFFALGIRRHNRILSPSPQPSARVAAWTGWLQRHANAVVAGAVIAMSLCAVGLGHLHTSVRIETLFPAHSKTMRDYAWLEKQVGPLVPIEILLEWDSASQPADRWNSEREWTTRLAEAVSRVPEVGAVLSAPTWLPESPPRQLPPELQTQWQGAARQVLTKAGYYRESPDHRVWRVSAYVSALAPLDYSELLATIRTRVEQQPPPNDICPAPRITYTGTMPLVHEIQKQLLRDLFASFLSALLLVTLVMTVVQAGFIAGLVTMLPNIFPIVILFGLLGWRNEPLDIGSVMTASVALGIAVDDTFHFVMAFRRQRSTGTGKRESVVHAYSECGRAMWQTSIVCGIGMLVFALSDFVPTRRFAWMMCVLLGLALAGDLLLLPALLLSPLGRGIANRTVTSNRESSAKPQPARSPANRHAVRPRRVA